MTTEHSNIKDKDILLEKYPTQFNKALKDTYKLWIDDTGISKVLPMWEKNGSYSKVYTRIVEERFMILVQKQLEKDSA